MTEEQNFNHQELDAANVADLLLNVAVTLSPALDEGRLSFDEASARLFGIVSEQDGGIVAYALGLDHADAMVRALNAAGGEYEAEMVSAADRV